ncbi:hypothetical protein ZEAMMB73_Zm00001d040975 [Zea mays]|uniref:Uncharacterized protein n=1 Tax=Zea mays TaxID=4577 RepID=A0A1D6MTN1_MAIZE|nr:hypothetical protein ZEAMMB73_Zm00001d040975 [Zea mays]
MVAASLEKLHCGEAGSGDKEKEVAGRDDAEVMSPQLSDEPLREKAQRIQVMLTGGMSERLPDRGKKLLTTLDAIHREQDRRQARGDGARAPGELGEEVESRANVKLLFNEIMQK